MEYIVIGNENCTRCDVVKDTLIKHNVKFEYTTTDNIDEKYIKFAIDNGAKSFPLIFNMGMNKLYNLQEIVGE